MSSTSQKLPNRYGVVAAGSVIQAFIVGGLFAYGVFFAELEAEFGWSRTVLSAATSLAFLTMGLLAPFAGRITDRFGPRWVLAFSGIVAGTGYLLLSTISAPWQLMALYGLCVGVGLATHDVVTLSTIAKWFDKKRGLMTSVVKIGTALGQVIAPPLAAWLIFSYGWRQALLIIGAASIVGLTIAAWRMIPRPAELDGAGAKRELDGISFVDAKKTRSFKTLCAIQFLIFCIVITLPTHLVVHGKDLGMDAASATLLLSVMGGFSIVGRLLVGLLVDQVGSRFAMVLAFITMTVSLAGLVVTSSPTVLFMLVAGYGVAHGGYFTVMSPAVAEIFGMKAHGAIFGAVIFFSTFGGALGPLSTGWVFDQTGSYTIAFTALALFAFIAFLLALTLPRKSVGDA